MVAIAVVSFCFLLTWFSTVLNSSRAFSRLGFQNLSSTLSGIEEVVRRGAQPFSCNLRGRSASISIFYISIFFGSMSIEKFYFRK